MSSIGDESEPWLGSHGLLNREVWSIMQHICDNGLDFAVQYLKGRPFIS